MRSVGLGDEHPAHRRRTIRPVHQRGAYPGPVLPVEIRECLDAHPVNTRCTCIGLDARPSPRQVFRLQYLLHHGLYPPNAPMLPVVSALAALIGHTAGRQHPPHGRDIPVQFSPSRHQVFRSLRLYGRSLAPGSLFGTMASADSPLRLPGAGPPQVRTRCSTARPPHLPIAAGLDGFAVLCQLTSPRRALICDFCSSACRFPLAFLPPVGYPSGVGFT